MFNFLKVISQLRSALHKHTQQVRKMAVQQLAGEKDRRLRTEGE